MRSPVVLGTVLFGAAMLFACHDSYPLVVGSQEAVSGPTETTSDAVQAAAADADGGGEPVPCGDIECEAGASCCDAECGLCSEPDGSCPESDCRQPEPGDECPADWCGERPRESCPGGEEVSAACVAVSDSECDWVVEDCPAQQCDDNDDCGRGQYCRFETGSCGVDGSTGECTAVDAGACGDRGPVCSCGGDEYDSECDAQQRGALVAYEGECTGDECWVPPNSDCCYSDDQCGRGEICRAGSCGDGLLGRCAVPIQAEEGDCFADFQCGFFQVCEGAFFCPCGQTCDRPDTLGRCESSFGGFGG